MTEQHPAPEDHTRPLPPFESPAPAETASPRPARGLTAAVLAGALVLGGTAGIGGAAWYDAWQGDDTSAASSTQQSSGGEITASTASVPPGTVEEVAQRLLPSVVKITVVGREGAGSGSGIILSEDGSILTNNHVVSVAEKDGITVAFNDGSTRKATIVGTDPVTDLAVIKAEGADDLTPAELGNSGALRVGQPVVAVGSPYGLNATVTTGIVSALNRAVSVDAPESTPRIPGFEVPREEDQSQAQDLSTTYPAIQTDAAINPGNSGGPLVNMAGQVVGINSSIRTSGGGLTEQGGSIGLGFAIPIDQVLPIVNQLIEGETPTHARMAVTVSDAEPSKNAQGAQIRSVQAGGPAAEAGLEVGDVITKVDDDVIDGSESLVAIIRGHRPGDSVELTYLRGGETRTTTVELGSDVEQTGS